MRLLPGETLMFLGDHTSPDSEGYVRVIRDVLARFHPTLRANLISAGSSEQTARAFNSETLHNLLISSRPDWLIIGIGLADALREPLLTPLVEQWTQARASSEIIESTFGHERSENGSGALSGAKNAERHRLTRLETFSSDLHDGVGRLAHAGLRPVLLTTVIAGDDLTYPLNGILKTYNKGIRDVAARMSVPLIDIERAFSDVFLRAVQYKQRVALAGQRGEIRPQGEALLARTVLQSFDALPHHGQRPLR